MNKPQIIDKERGPRQGSCTRCGGEGQWRFLDPEKTIVEVECPDCGRFQVPRADFDQAETEIVEASERRE